MALKMDPKILVLFLALIQIKATKTSPDYHLLSSNGMPPSHPYQTVRTPYKQQCISMCATSPTECRSFAVQQDAGWFRCLLFDVTTNVEDLLPSTGMEYFLDIQSCQDWYRVGARVSGVYEMNLMGKGKRRVSCNMEVSGGGWMVIFRKNKASNENFQRTWEEYREGFGDINREFRMGNELINRVTNSGAKYYIFVWAKTFDGNITVSKYGSFYIEEESNDYRIHFDDKLLEGFASFGGDNGNNDKNVNGMGFSTLEIDNDGRSGNCAGKHGPSWYNDCSRLHVFKNNKLVWHSPHNYYQIMEWMIKEM
ncbi:ryncolin-1-like [Clytia hemisphaerica]|uniref:Fibrinogen C-terminal domain-containing protein n=1 Tax=Clytia hemisphaerica TaxID=252671 RepID=A0A7M5WUI5_9CNID